MNHTLIGIAEICIFLILGTLSWRPMRRLAVRCQHDVSRE
jgi:hypothetical protein